MKYLLLSLLITITVNTCYGGITSDISEINKTLDDIGAKLNCLNKMQKTDFNKFKQVRRCKNRECIRAFLNKWEDACIKEQLGKHE